MPQHIQSINGIKDRHMKILSCNSNRPLAEAIASYLNLPVTKADVRRFADNEIFVEIHENVRGEDVFVVQSTSFPANDKVMELLVTLDALRRGSARRPTPTWHRGRRWLFAFSRRARLADHARRRAARPRGIARPSARLRETKRDASEAPTARDSSRTWRGGVCVARVTTERT